MFGIGQGELLLVAFVALLLFGNRLPSVMRNIGSGVSEFRKGMTNVRNDFEKSIDSAGK